MAFFCECSLACVTGKNDWTQQTKTDLIREIAIILAFALLFLKNMGYMDNNGSITICLKRKCAATDSTKQLQSG